MKYFTIMTGLAGCFMPENSHTIAVETRRDLKAALEWEARDRREAGFVGLSKRSIAWLANAAWAQAHGRGQQKLPYAVYFGYRTHTAHSLGVAVATRDEYKAYCEENA